MMTKLREFSTTFLIILVLAFVGMMVFEWGMDYTGMSRSQKPVGEVNGEKLSFEQFSELYQQLYQNERERNKDVEFDDNKLKTIRDQVWEQFVQRVLFKEEMQRLNITVSDSEIVHQIRYYPLEEIKNNSAFQTDGAFDWNKYYQSFNNPQIPWADIENFYRQQLPFVKLQNIITSSVRVSDLEIEDEIEKANQTIKVEYIETPFSVFNTGDLEITDEEVKKFYNEHIEDYQVNESRRLAYVLFPLSPTKADTQRTLRTFDEIKSRIANGVDFNELADEYSEDPGVKDNHGLYDFFERGVMVPEFEEAAFNGKPGEIIGPVKTKFGYHIIKVEDKRIKDSKEQVKASHILISVTTGPSTREEMADKAALFSEDAKTKGFDIVAEKEKYKIEETAEITEVGTFIPGFGKSYGIHNFAFTSEINDVSDYMETDKGFAVFKLFEIKPAGPKPLEELEGVVKNRAKLEKAKELTKDYTKKFEPQIKESANWKDVLASDEKDILVYDSTDAFKFRASARKIGYSTDFNAAAFALEKNQTSDMVETNKGIYYLRLLEKSQLDSAAYAQQYKSTSQRLLNQKRSKVFEEWYNYLKEKADIVDNRKVYNL